MEYELCWMDDKCGIVATTVGEFENLQEAIKFAYAASFREDGEGATQLNITLVQ